jgi:tryptophan 2-monooxygenase
MRFDSGSAGQGVESAEMRRSKWQVGYPNSADFNFDYHRLLSEAHTSGLGSAPASQPRIAVVGAGIAGLTAARELFRCGYTSIDIFEATDRLGGRLYSKPVNGQHTTFELGAMRLPLFEQDGRPVSVAGYYKDHFRLATQPFPNPGDAGRSGIYVNDGYGADIDRPLDRPTLLSWDKGSAPPDPILAAAAAKWRRFETLLTTEIAARYGTPDWTPFWRAVITHYWTLSFRALVHLEALPAYDPQRPGVFGGLGLTQGEAEAVQQVGVGDGSWAAYFDTSSLYIIRTLMFGFARGHRLFQGRFSQDGHHVAGPHHGEVLTDSLGQPIAAPRYLGIQSLADCMFFMPVESGRVAAISPYDAVHDGRYQMRLLTRCPVRSIEHRPDGRLHVTSAAGADDYDAVILTPPTSAMEMSVAFSGFPRSALPPRVISSIRSAHWVSSVKVFAALKQRFWERTAIPQIITTDSFIQRVYGYAVDTASIADPGVVLLSYSWEDNASKLLADVDDDELVGACLRELDRMLAQCGVGARLSDFVDTGQTAVIRWSREPTFRGCSRVYREGSWNELQPLLTYNQELSSLSGLYFAGEAIAVDGGWTEPALRSAIDAVLHVVRNTGGTMANDFDMGRDYPRHDTAWTPAP